MQLARSAVPQGFHDRHYQNAQAALELSYREMLTSPDDHPLGGCY
ncbi:hypothetical protein [Saccharopolyspora phatthalungensis]|uniref:Uncharacterized protein n=1 Tax=Saccharopolyspora phatthalungensis TaxID=664693 RepID=A0A840QEF4_9PSEU|nr:hypothetical protein [Saccharopolyspora phatthalungensis]MBB5157058.1 hypothetical protein [Saccharopolyspora phatthalungensis]